LVEGKQFLVVSPGYLEEKGILLKENKIKEIEEQGKSVVFRLEGIRYLELSHLLILFWESHGSHLKTQRRGNKVSHVIGDNRYVAAWLARELELADCFAGVLPHEKAEKVKEVQIKYTTGMVETE